MFVPVIGLGITPRSSGEEELEARSGARRRLVEEWFEWAMLGTDVSGCIDAGALVFGARVGSRCGCSGLDFGMSLVVILASGGRVATSRRMIASPSVCVRTRFPSVDSLAI